MGLFWEYDMHIFSTLFWLKLITLGLTIVFIRSYKNKEFYYYQNLGLSRTFLWVTTLSFDFVLYLSLLIGVYHFSAPQDVKKPMAAGTVYVVNTYFPPPSKPNILLHPSQFNVHDPYLASRQHKS